MNTSMVTDIPKTKSPCVYGAAFSDIAENLGSVKSANMVALGAYVEKKKIVSSATVLKLLPEAFKHKPGLVSLNELALYEGMKA